MSRWGFKEKEPFYIGQQAVRLKELYLSPQAEMIALQEPGFPLDSQDKAD